MSDDEPESLIERLETVHSMVPVHEALFREAARRIEQLEREREELRNALQDLAWRHGWSGEMGPCICSAHQKVTALGISYETPSKGDQQ